MTACVNNKKYGRRVAGVVTASLVGALTLGGVSLAAVPTVALADQDASLQFATGTQFTNGDIEGLKVGNNTVTNGSYQLTSSDSLPLHVSATGVQVAGSTVTTPLDKTDNTKNYTLRVYAADKDGNPTGASLSGNNVLRAGKYVVVASGVAGSQYAGQTVKASLDVKAADLPKVLTAYEDETDSEFVFTGKDLVVDHIAGDGATLKEGVEYSVVSIYKDGAKVDSVKDAGRYTVNVTGLGLYEGSKGNFSIDVKPFDLGNSDLTVAPFTNDNVPVHATRVYDAATNTELDPSLVGLTVHKGDGTMSQVALDANGKVVAWGSTSTVSTVTPELSGTMTQSGKAYLFDADVNKSLVNSGNVVLDASDTTGTYNGDYMNAGDKNIAQAVAYMVKSDVAFKYDKQALADSYEVDASKDDAFDVSAIKGYYDNNGKSTAVPASDIQVEVTRAGGLTVDGTTYTDGKTALAENAYGTYTVTVTALDASGYAYGGGKTFTVKVWAGSVDADASLYVYELSGASSLDSGKAIDRLTVAYDGTAITANGNFRVDGKDSAGNDINGWNDNDGNSSDLKVKLVDSEGKEVYEAKAAGSYKLVVTSDKYKLSGTTELPVTIEKPDLSTLAVGALKSWNNTVTGTSDKYLPLTGKVWLDTDADGKADDLYENVIDYVANTGKDAVESLKLTSDAGSLKKQALSDNLDIKVEYKDGDKWVEVGSIESFKENSFDVLYGEGDYRVTIKPAADEASNYVLPAGQDSVSVEFRAAYGKGFTDVLPTDWYYDWVSKATASHFMNGDKDANGEQTGTFRPESALTRAEAVTVLYNMSGQENDENESSSPDKGYVTGFDDVATDHWAAKYIKWARQAGVVKGYDGTNDFKADQTVTRNEFAQMLYNYAKNVAKDSTTGSVDTSKLAFADGVDGWAQTAVAWATSVEDADGNHVISGYPQDNTFKGGNQVKRGEVAKMTVVYQPKGQLR